MDVASYLERIGDRGSTEPTVATLNRLHQAHLYSVPFENLDVHLGRSIELSLLLLFDKVVGHHRGGFCYELNSLFGWLLRELGYTVDLLSARVYSNGVPGAPFDHLLLRVMLDEPWLADVGFGDSFVRPLSLTPGEQVQADFTYCLEMDEVGGVLYRRRSPTEGWDPQYLFSLHPRQLEDFQEMCGYHQSSPESPFTRKSLCSLATPDGRITLSNDRLIQTCGEHRQEQIIAIAEEYKALLHQHFGIDLDDAVDVTRLMYPHPKNGHEREIF